MKKCLTRAAEGPQGVADDAVYEDVEGEESVPGVDLDVEQVDVKEVGVLLVFVVSAAVSGRAVFSELRGRRATADPGDGGENYRPLRLFDGCLPKSAAGF